MSTAVPSFHITRRQVMRGALAGLGVGMLGPGGESARAAQKALPTAGVVFDANYPASGFNRYLDMYPQGVREGVDFGLAAEPVRRLRKVAFFDNFRQFHEGATKPRAAAESQRVIRPVGPTQRQDEYWFGASYYVPSATAPRASDDWFSLMTPAYGPPFNGTSPLSVVLWPKTADSMRVVLGGDYRLLGWDFAMPLDTWCRILINFKFAYQGWAKIWVGTGLGSTSWQQVPLRGTTGRFAMATMARGVNDACANDLRAQANSSRIGAYGAVSRVFVGHHTLTTSSSAVSSLMR